MGNRGLLSLKSRCDSIVLAGCYHKGENMEKRAVLFLRVKPELVPLLDAEAKKRDRSRTWLAEHVLELWLKRLESARERRAKPRRKGRRET